MIRAIVVTVVVLLAGGCTSEIPGGGEPVTSRPISPTAGATVDSAPHLSVTAPEGAVGEPATLSVTASEVERPDHAGFMAAGGPVEVTVDAPLLRPVQLTFDGAGGPQNGIPVVLHHDPATGWYPIEVGEPGQPVVVQRTALSPFALGWFTEAVDWLGDRLAGRGDPPACDAGAPAWAAFTSPVVDMLTSCVTGDGANARVKLRNNRALPLEVTVPPGTAAVSVEDQPDVVRQVLGSLLGPGKVLLLPGQVLVLDWAQPQQDSEVGVLAAFSPTSILPGIAAEALGYDDAPTLLAFAVHIGQCAAAQGELGRSFGSVDMLPALLDWLVACLGPLVAATNVAIGAARSAVALVNGVTEAVAESDQKFAGQLDKVSNGLRVIGKLVKAYTVIKMAGALTQVFVDVFGPNSDRTTVLRFLGSRQVTAVDAARFRVPVNFDFEMYAFQSPSGRFLCGIHDRTGSESSDRSSAGCQGGTNPVPPRPPDCDIDISWGAGLIVDETGATTFMCAGGLMYGNGETPPTLPYGSAISALGFTCESAETGMRCVHDGSGHGFRIATASNERF